MKRERILGFDFIRAISALGIIAHHLYAEYVARGVDLNRYWGQGYANGNYGWLFVTLFFMLSGATMYTNYPELNHTNIKRYYYKRWRGLFPAFYLAWSYYYVQRVLEKGELFYNGNPMRFIWTILGMDGYVSLKTTTYYILGEWFLGPIIIIYIIYPAVLKLYNKYRWKALAVIFGAFLVINAYGISLQTGPFRSITSSLLSFYSGMILAGYRQKMENKWAAFGAIIVSAVFLTIEIVGPEHENLFVHLFGIVLFAALYNVGKKAMGASILNKIISFISSVSYEVFLLQHMIILQVVNGISIVNISGWKYVCLLFLTSVIIILQAWALLQVKKGLMQTKPFMALEKQMGMK